MGAIPKVVPGFEQQQEEIGGPEQQLVIEKNVENSKNIVEKIHEQPIKLSNLPLEQQLQLEENVQMKKTASAKSPKVIGLEKKTPSKENIPDPETEKLNAKLRKIYVGKRSLRRVSHPSKDTPVKAVKKISKNISAKKRNLKRRRLSSPVKVARQVKKQTTKTIKQVKKEDRSIKRRRKSLRLQRSQLLDESLVVVEKSEQKTDQVLEIMDQDVEKKVKEVKEVEKNKQKTDKVLEIMDQDVEKKVNEVKKIEHTKVVPRRRSQRFLKAKHKKIENETRSNEKVDENAEEKNGAEEKKSNEKKVTSAKTIATRRRSIRVSRSQETSVPVIKNETSRKRPITTLEKYYTPIQGKSLKKSITRQTAEEVQNSVEAKKVNTPEAKVHVLKSQSSRIPLGDLSRKKNISINTSQRLPERVLIAAEFYFSNSNLSSDKYLRDLVERNDGWVSISTLASFSRIKGFGMNRKTLISALRSSKEFLEVDDQGKNVRRHLPLPSSPDLYNSTIYAKGFPLKTTVQFVRNFFQKYLNPGHSICCVRLRNLRQGNLSFKGSVFVEFSSVEEAERISKLQLATHDNKPMVLMMMNDYINMKNNEHASRSQKQKKQRKKKKKKKKKKKS